VNIFTVAATTFDDTYIALLGECFDIVNGRFVEFDQLDELQNAVIYIENRHVTSKTTG
jgi:hypothetical protein